MESSKKLLKALDKFWEARRKLDEYREPFKYEWDGDVYTVSCPTCGIIFYKGVFGGNISFSMPIICCNKIRYY